MNPDIAVAIRTLLIALGGGAVAKGWVTESALEPLVGAVVVIATALWGWWSNRPQSKEAQKVAERVADSDVPGIIRDERKEDVPMPIEMDRRES